MTILARAIKNFLNAPRICAVIIDSNDFICV